MVYDVWGTNQVRSSNSNVNDISDTFSTVAYTIAHTYSNSAMHAPRKISLLDGLQWILEENWSLSGLSVCVFLGGGGGGELGSLEGKLLPTPALIGNSYMYLMSLAW